MKPAITQALVVIHASGVVAIAVLAFAAWRIRCEGFGCIGVGIAWFGWACLFATWLLVGLLARHESKDMPRWNTVSNYAIAIQGAVGLIPLGYWTFEHLS